MCHFQNARFRRPRLADLVADFHARLNDDDTKKVSRRVRPEHKFHKKRKEKRRIKHKGAGENKDVGGQGFLMGKRGGMMPAHLQANVRSAIGDEVVVKLVMLENLLYATTRSK